MKSRFQDFHFLNFFLVFVMVMFCCVCRGQADKDFRVEVEAIGHVRHKNLVRLLGYCMEGTQRYVYVLLLNDYFLNFTEQWMW